MASHLSHLSLKLALLDRGVESFSIEYDSLKCVFLPGEVVHGHVVIQIKDAIKAKAVIVNMIGRGRTSWTVWEQYSSNRSTHSEAIPYYAEETYIDTQATVWHCKENDKLNPGLHRFPFLFTIPDNCPPSYEGATGFIRYYCKAKIDRPWKFDDSTRCGFTVLPHFDLNSLYYSAFPMSKEFDKQIGFLCIKHGQLNAKVNLCKCGYVPGESIVLNMEIRNGTAKDVSRIETALLEVATFTAHRGRLHHFHYGLGTRHNDTEKKKESRIVVQYIEEFKVPKTTSATYMRMLAIPPIVPSFDCCKIIQVDYLFKIKIVLRGHFGSSVSGEVPILIGTIPVRHSSSAPPNATVMSQDYLSPAQPTLSQNDDEQTSLITSNNSNNQVSYTESVFGKGVLVEDKDDRTIGFTPKYIYYNDYQ